MGEKPSKGQILGSDELMGCGPSAEEKEKERMQRVQQGRMSYDDLMKEFDSLWKDVDCDESGTLDQEEVKKLIANMAKNCEIRVIKEGKELKLGEPNEDVYHDAEWVQQKILDDGYLKQCINALDKNHDGKIEKEEFRIRADNIFHPVDQGGKLVCLEKEHVKMEGGQPTQQNNK